MNKVLLYGDEAALDLESASLSFFVSSVPAAGVLHFSLGPNRSKLVFRELFLVV